MKLLRKTINAKTLMILIPIPIFGFLLQLWAFITFKPVFTKKHKSITQVRTQSDNYLYDHASTNTQYNGNRYLMELHSINELKVKSSYFKLKFI